MGATASWGQDPQNPKNFAKAFSLFSLFTIKNSPIRRYFAKFVDWEIRPRGATPSSAAPLVILVYIRRFFAISVYVYLEATQLVYPFAVENFDTPPLSLSPDLDSSSCVSPFALWLSHLHYLHINGFNFQQGHLNSPCPRVSLPRPLFSTSVLPSALRPVLSRTFHAICFALSACFVLY